MFKGKRFNEEATATGTIEAGTIETGGKRKRRRVRGFAAAAVAVPAAFASMAITASAHADYIGTGTFKNLQTGRCLDSNYNGNIYTLPCNGGNYQNWNPIYLGHNNSDVVLLQDVQTGLCLTNHGLDNWVDTESCDSGNSQQHWNANGSGWNDVNFLMTIPTSRGFYTKALDSDYNGNVYPNDFNNGLYQHWGFNI